jgi:uncharacterized membrane protein YcaP (DUF421 family)
LVLVFWSSWQSIGTILATAILAYTGLLAILSPDVSAADGLTALGVLVALQFVVTFASVRIGTVRAAVKASPTRVVKSGMMQHDVMRRERITEDDVYQAVRASGTASLRDIDVVLETSGHLSVVRLDEGPREALDNVR